MQTVWALFSFFVWLKPISSVLLAPSLHIQILNLADHLTVDDIAEEESIPVNEVEIG